MPANADRGRVVIAGGSGFLGLSLATHLTTKGWSVAVLSRHPPRRDGPWSHFSWDARTLGDWSRALDGSCGLVNLVGRSVDCINTPDHQDEIIRSRTESRHGALGLAVRSVKATALRFGYRCRHVRRTSTVIRPESPAPKIRPSALVLHHLSGERGNVNLNRMRCPRSVVWYFGQALSSVATLAPVVVRWLAWSHWCDSVWVARLDRAHRG